jgi:predicted ATPase/DNA-binding SARP family transcriptional activator/DNA-binding CsgD family transcriptional regulator/Flp pilus assembly protein TadD
MTTMVSRDRSAPEAVRVCLLGGFRVSVGSQTIGEDHWRLRKAASLIKLLALTPSHRLHRERAMDLLWPELGKKAASNNLRQTLHVARRTLHPDPEIASACLTVSGEQLLMCPAGPLWVDVGAFEEAAKAARRSGDPAAYRAAIELYSGELLPEDRYEEWAETRRQELKEEFLSLLVELATLYEERGEYLPGIETLKRVLGEEPVSEEAHAGLMRLYALSGRQGEALKQYVRLSEALSSGLGAEPSASARALREEIAIGRFPADPTQPAGLSTGETAGGGGGEHNLPAQRTSFVGRERELLEVKRALAITRLLTLTGAGGSGKTRLALEVARDLVGAYPDGVWLTELAGISDGELVPQAVAEALGVHEEPTQPLTETLVESLRSKSMLLVLDNCEHLIETAARLADTLLDGCPRLRILATSREALGVAGETLWSVPALSVPDSQPMPTVADLEGYEAARLFVERASDRRPGFALEPANATAVAEVCRRLDGVPLAIELAAARVSTMSVEQISERLGDSLGLLTGGGRTAVPRQRTLRGALDWSHELLSNEERTLFGRLSVFAGGWTLEAVEAVAPGDDNEKGEILDLLSRLVDKSLVVADAAAEGEMRYGMLEPVRQYARERLKESGEADAVMSRHAAYFLAEAEAAEPELVGRQPRWWLNRLEHEHANMRAALSWSLERRDELGLRLGGALARFWYTRGYLSEGRRWLEDMLSAVGGATSAPVRAKALGEAGWLAQVQGDYEQARVAHEASLDTYRRLRNERGLATCLRNLGSVAAFQGDHERAAELLGESLKLLRQWGTNTDVVRVLTTLGILAISRGEHAQAVARFEEAMSLARKTGDVRGVAVSLNNLGHVALLRGDAERATALFEETLAKDREVGETQGIASSLINLGLAALARGDHGQATGLLVESLTLLREVQNKLDMVECMEAIAGVAGAQGQAQRAARLWGAAQAVREDMGAPLQIDDLALLEPYLTTARSLLEEEAWELARTEGRAMTLERAVEYAVSEEEAEPQVSPTPKRRPPAGAQPDLLTGREREVAAMVARGMSNRQISEELYLSERTIENHISKILRKLKRSSRAEIAAWATQQELLVSNPD